MKITKLRLEQLVEHGQALLRAIESGIPISDEDQRLITAMSEQMSQQRDLALYLGHSECGLGGHKLQYVSGKSHTFTVNLISQGRLVYADRAAKVPSFTPANVDEINLNTFVLGTRTHNLLQHHKIYTIGQVRKYSVREFLKLAGVGLHSLELVQAGLQQYGVTLQEN
jgi:hypothetical protein